MNVTDTFVNFITDVQIRRESIEVEIPPAPEFRIREESLEVEIPALQTRITPSK